ncbi:alpha/beta fold hydrolase [Nemorincola caseinilytica]|uniref:Alpha/beta fold hydrolase n=1 Tax=Nemorincola caseinilytica TaxID=2054315 RepID=A0ABP8N9U1_9BACT
MPHISIGAEQLHYLRMGTGSDVLLAFHGYGEHAGTFSVFEEHLGHRYTILSFDLPYHGGTAWRGKEHLTADDLVILVANVMVQFGVDKISLMGYSIGGRVCLSAMAAAPQHIHRVLLMATDGLTVNPFYRFFTRVPAGKYVFRRFLQAGEGSIRLTDLCRRLRLIPDAFHRLATQTLRSQESRLQLLHAWPCLSHLVQPPKVLRSVIATHKIPVFLYMGASDRVLPPSLAQPFAKGMDTVQLYILEKGHRIFDTGNAAHIAASLL